MSNTSHNERDQKKAEIQQQIIDRWNEIEVQMVRHPEWTVRNVTDYLGITEKRKKIC